MSKIKENQGKSGNYLLNLEKSLENFKHEL